MGQQEVEALGEALVREYLSSKGLKGALEALNKELPPKEDRTTKRSELSRSLGIEKMVKRNKEKGEEALASCLEVLVEYLHNKAVALKEKKSEETDKREKTEKNERVDKANKDEKHEGHSKAKAKEKHVDSERMERPRTDHHGMNEDVASIAVGNESSAGFMYRRRGHESSRGHLDSNVCVVEDLDDLADEVSSMNFREQAPPSHKDKVSFKFHRISIKEAFELRSTVFGNARIPFPSSWRQGFFFNPLTRLKYGLVQKEGGPCGVLACVQAYLIKNLLCKRRQFDPEALREHEVREALLDAICDILWQAGGGKAILAITGSQRALLADEDEKMQFNYKDDGFTECLMICQVDSRNDLRTLIQDHQQGTEVAIRLLSLAMTFTVLPAFSIPRSFPGEQVCVRSDKTLRMTTCFSQEMVNLLLVGKAVPNVFDGTKELDGLTLNGITCKTEIGFFSLFEHYRSIEVGSLLKNPKYPVWVVCSESHFSVFFSSNLNALEVIMMLWNENRPHGPARNAKCPRKLTCSITTSLQSKTRLFGFLCHGAMKTLTVPKGPWTPAGTSLLPWSIVSEPNGLKLQWTGTDLILFFDSICLNACEPPNSVCRGFQEFRIPRHIQTSNVISSSKMTSTRTRCIVVNE
eukprot:768524-Hanusia_phi.AAC.6